MTTIFYEKLITFEYINYRGEQSTRTAKVIKISYGETAYHSGDQWILSGYDYDKQENRDFAMKDMMNVRHYNPDEDETNEQR